MEPSPESCCRLRALSATMTRSNENQDRLQDTWSQNDDDDDDDIDFLFEELEVDGSDNRKNDITRSDAAHDEDDDETEQMELEPVEKLWRHAKKPLLRIGAKGATHSHGNSLRQLLEDHTVVKVKINTRKYNDSLEEASNVLKEFAVENGAPANIEIIQLREGDKTVLFGMPGTVKDCVDGTFPPPPPPPPPSDESSLKA
jgi:RNA-binding protein YhbY